MTAYETDARKLARLKTARRRGDISRRGFLTAAMGLSSAALLTGCAGGLAGAGGLANPSVIPLYTVENDPATLAFFNMVIEEFQADHPDIQVKVTVYADSNALQYLTTAMRNGVDIGIFAVPENQIPAFAEAGYLAELDDVVQDIGEDDFLPGTRRVVGGHDYAMPAQNNAGLLYYRKDLLEGAGLPVPTTYDELHEAISTLHGQDGISGIAMGTGPTPQLAMQSFAPYLLQSGFDYYDREGNLTFDQPEVLDAVHRFTGLMRNTADSMYNAGFGDIVSAYTSGRAAFATFPGRLGYVLYDRDKDLADRTGVMRIPGGPFMTGGLHFGSNQTYGVFADTGNLTLAKDLLQRMTTGEAALAFAKTVPGHLMPPLRSVMEMYRAEVEAGTEPYFRDHGDWLLTFADAVPQAMSSSTAMGSVAYGEFTEKRSNLCPWAADVWSSPPVDATMFQQILIDGRSEEDAWTEASARLGEIADTWKRDHPEWAPEETA